MSKPNQSDKADETVMMAKEFIPENSRDVGEMVGPWFIKDDLPRSTKRSRSSLGSNINPIPICFGSGKLHTFQNQFGYSFGFWG